MVIEIDLHLNTRPPAYRSDAVQRLILAAQDYLAANAGGAMRTRLVSSQASQIRSDPFGDLARRSSDRRRPVPFLRHLDAATLVHVRGLFARVAIPPGSMLGGLSEQSDSDQD